LFQKAANWGARRGGAVGNVVLNAAAAANGVAEAAGINDLGNSISEGSVSGTAFVAAGLLPVGKALKAGKIFRAGRTNPGNFTPRAGEEAVSFRNSLSNPIDSKANPVFKPGTDFVEVDVARLPNAKVVLDNSPPGHVSVSGASAQELKDAVIDRGRLP
jgi:hypothetical protein